MNSLLGILLAAVILLIGMIQLPAHGQGLGFVESNSVVIENKRVSVTIDMKPVFVTENDKEGSVTIRLREVNTDSTVPHVTYHVKVTRASELLLDEKFHSHSGTVSLRLEHTDEIEVIGERESLYNSVIADKENPAIVKGPILTGGLYYYNVSILSMREYENRLAEPLNFDLYTSIGKTSSIQVLDTDGRQSTLSIKTYYDDIENIEYDSSSKTVTFTMPFNWDPAFLANVPFIHEEVQFPRDFGELMVNSYIGTINGVELSNKEVMIDDSLEDKRTVHFMMSKDRLMSVAKQQKEQDVAIFTLAPREVPKFPLEILSNDENFLLQISWSPGIIEPRKSTKFIVTVRDPATLDTINHATADFVLLKDGKELFRNSHRAPIGAIVQDYSFTEEQGGTVQLLIENINNTGESASLLITVVPEFPLGQLVAMIGVISTVIAITKIKKIFTK